MKNKKHSISRGKLVGENGPGSIYIDTYGISYIISSVDLWYEKGKNINEEAFKINDLRLESILDVDYFKEIPAYKRKSYDIEEENVEMEIPIHQFPLLHYCKECMTFNKFQQGTYEKKKYCEECKKSTEFTQFPIVVACENGHIDDIDYVWLVHKDFQDRQKNMYDNDKHKIKLIKNGNSILNGTLKCSCGAYKNLSGLTGHSTISDITPYQRESGIMKCKGHRPWDGYGEKDVDCSGHPTAILRNALDIYRPNLVPVLSITEKEDHLSKNYDDILSEEFKKLTLNSEEFNKKLVINKAFDCDDRSIIKSVYSVRKLEELVVQTGFNRLGNFDEHQSLEVGKNITEKNKIFKSDNNNWLPAKKLYGEGIFIEFNKNTLNSWVNLEEVQNHFQNYSKNKKTNEHTRFDNPVSVLIHTISHGLIKQLGTKSGYPLPAIREKLYLNEDEYGILIYVTDTDKEGTFGGLCRLANPDYFKIIFSDALKNMRWCSSDPVCSEIGKEFGQGIKNTNGASCHNCNFVPTTSCAHNNCYLDRDLVSNINSSSAINNFFGWFEDKNEKSNLKVEILNKGEKHFYKNWDDLVFEYEQDFYKKINLTVPEYFEGEVLIGDKLFDVKYLWSKEKVLILYHQNEQKDNIDDINDYLGKIDGWKVIEEKI